MGMVGLYRGRMWMGNLRLGESPTLTWSGWSTSVPADLVLHDFGEGLGIEAGSAYKRAIDFGLVEEGGGIVRLNAASIEDADCIGDMAAKAAGDLTADEQVG